MGDLTSLYDKAIRYPTFSSIMDAIHELSKRLASQSKLTPQQIKIYTEMRDILFDMIDELLDEEFEEFDD